LLQKLDWPDGHAGNDCISVRLSTPEW
jgi:hypothetical protein